MRPQASVRVTTASASPFVATAKPGACPLEEGPASSTACGSRPSPCLRNWSRIERRNDSSETLPVMLDRMFALRVGQWTRASKRATSTVAKARATRAAHPRGVGDGAAKRSSAGGLVRRLGARRARPEDEGRAVPRSRRGARGGRASCGRGRSGCARAPARRSGSAPRPPRPRGRRTAGATSRRGAPPPGSPTRGERGASRTSRSPAGTSRPKRTRAVHVVRQGPSFAAVRAIGWRDSPLVRTR